MKTKIKNKTGQLLTITLAFILVLTLASNTHAQILNFSGDWKVDTTKTNYGKAGPFSTPIEMKISQTADTLSIERITRDHLGGIHSYTENLALNGVSADVLIRNSVKKQAAIKWSADKKTLVETAQYEDPNAPEQYQHYRGTETWTLSGDGKILAIDRTDDGEDEHDVSKMVYNKQ